jgi:hypothetical protein
VVKVRSGVQDRIHRRDLPPVLAPDFVPIRT